MADEYKVVADKIVSSDPDIILSVAGGVYINSISNNTKVATMADVGNGGGSSADIADFVFTDVDSENSSITVTGDKELTIQSGASEDLNVRAGDDLWLTADDEIFVQADDDINLRSQGSTSILTNYVDLEGNEYVWEFGSQGYLTLPGGGEIINSPNSSGDGSGYSTLKLDPDNTLETDQYIIIDPTGPNHVHIRAGGTQDNSGAELILGAEKTNVKVSDYYGRVTISTSSENHTFTRTNEEIAESSTFSNNDSLDLYNVAEPGWVAINPAGTVAEITGTELVEDSIFEATVAEVNFFQPATSYTFRSGSNFDGDRYWVFGADGVLEGPAEGGVRVLSVNNAPGNTLNVQSNSNVLINAVNEVIISSETDDIYLAAAGAAYIGMSSSTEDKIATLGDIGEDTSFTVVGGTLGDAPTFTGDPLFTGSYVKTGPMVHFRIDVDFDNITSFGTGQYYLDLPFPSKYSYKFRDGCLHDISETINYAISGHVAAGESRMYLFSTDTQSGKVFDVAFMHNNPVALATADNFHIAGDYIWEPEAP
jgi:hypothetical protein